MIKKITYTYTPQDNTNELIKKNEELQSRLTEVEQKHIILADKVDKLEKAPK